MTRQFIGLLAGPLLLAAGPAIIQGPAVDAVTYSSARITWLTDQPARTRIRYGLRKTDGDTIDTRLNRVHSWFLSGLAPATTYRYKACSEVNNEETCSDEHTLTTAATPPTIPAPPEPPRAHVDVSLPAGAYGAPFVIDAACSNLPDVLTRLASLTGPLNYEVRIPARTTCAGLWMFPARPNHTGWVVLRTAEDLPPEGKHIGPEDYRGMARFVTNALPGYQFSKSTLLKQTTCVTGAYLWVTDLPGMALQVCKPEAPVTGNSSRDNAWTPVPSRSGNNLPRDCSPNEWFLKTDVKPLDSVYWCTSANTWTRVRPGNYTNANLVAALQFAPQASRYRFVGIEVTHIPVPNPPPPEWSLRDYKQGNFGALVATAATNDRIIFDRCDIHGLDYPGRLGRGLYLNGSNVAVIHSRVHKINRWGEGTDAVTGSEAAAIDIGSGPGPGIIEDNFLEAIGITIFFPNAGKNALPPADYVIRHNLFSHPDTYLYGSPQNWSGKSYANRQVIELKAGRRFLIEGNIFDGNWADVTQGAMVMFTPRSVPAAPPKKITSLHDGVLTVAGTADPYTPGLLVSVQGTASSLDGIWEVAEVLSPTSYRLKGIPDGSASAGTVMAVTSNMQISDIDIRNNVFRNGPNLLWINGHDVGITTRTTQRIRFHNNLVTGMDARAAAKGGRVSPVGANRNGRSGIAAFVAFGMEDLIVTNNTIVDFKGNAPHFLFFDSTKNGSHAGLKVSENIFTAEDARVASISGGNAGTPALDLQWTAWPKGNWAFDNNVICCNVRETVRRSNIWPGNTKDIGVETMRSGIRVSPGRYGSKNIGVNVQELEAALAVKLDQMNDFIASQVAKEPDRQHAKSE